MAWFDLHEQTGDPMFSERYREALIYSLRTQQDFLPGDSDPNRVMDRLHAYSYFLEGLLPVAGETGAVRRLRAREWRAWPAYLREIAPAFERSDVYAQLLRVRLFADQAGVVPLDRDAARSKRDRLAEFQSDESRSGSGGGFWFGRKGEETLPFINPVSAAFGLQALAMWRDYCRRPPPDRHALI